MTVFDYLSSAFRTLTNNKLRTFLTTLGIVIGISSVILISMLGGSLGETLNDYFNELFKQNYMYFELDFKDGCQYEGDAEERDYFLYEEQLRVLSEDVMLSYEKIFKENVSRVVVHQDLTFGQIAESSEENYIVVQGVSAAGESLIGGSICNGRFITDEDCENAASVCVISEDAAEKRFGNTNPIGMQIDLVSESENFSSFSATIIGVYKVNPLFGTINFTGKDCTFAAVPPEYMEKITGNTTEINSYAEYQLKNIKDRDYFERSTTEFFNKHLEGTDYEIKVFFLEDTIDEIKSIVKLVTGIVGAIAAISLFIGGVGVMNVMIVSVTERTMEIGARKALGANNRSIYIQFMTESVLIVLIGAVVGILLGLFLSKCIALLLTQIAIWGNFTVNISFKLPIKMIIISVLFSFAVGIIFGLYPAQKASKMEIVDALRYE